MSNYIYILAGFIIGIIFAIIISFVKKTTADKNILKSTELAKKIIDDAQSEVVNLKKAATLEAKEEWYKIQKGYEDEINNRKKEIHILEKEYNERVSKLDNRLENLDRKESNLQEFEKKIKIQEVEIKQKKIELDELIDQQNQK